jgi:hypothetical protein
VWFGQEIVDLEERANFHALSLGATFDVSFLSAHKKLAQKKNSFIVFVLSELSIALEDQ